jgi:hypothetical protein
MLFGLNVKGVFTRQGGLAAHLRGDPDRSQACHDGSALCQRNQGKTVEVSLLNPILGGIGALG